MRLEIDEAWAKRGDLGHLIEGARLQFEHENHLLILSATKALSTDAMLAIATQLAGFSGFPQRRVDRDEARALLAAVMQRDLAYSTMRASDTFANGIAAAFIALFPGEHARFFTNGGIGLAHAGLGTDASWTPLTKATFDTGIVAVDSGNVGVFWFQDED